MNCRNLQFAWLFIGILLISCKSTYQFQQLQQKNITLKEGSDPLIEKFYLPFKLQLDSSMNMVLGQNSELLVLNRPESNLGNWFCDAFLDQCILQGSPKLDFFCSNYGGFRIARIPQGAITRRQIYELLPFENNLVVLEVSGARLKSWCAIMAEKGGWPVSSGFQMGIREQEAIDIKIQGLVLDTNKTYIVGTNDYIAAGGDNCSFLKDCKILFKGTTLREAVFRQLELLQKEGKQVRSGLYGRVVRH